MPASMFVRGSGRRDAGGGRGGRGGCAGRASSLVCDDLRRDVRSSRGARRDVRSRRSRRGRSRGRHILGAQHGRAHQGLGEQLVAFQTIHGLGPDVLELEVLRAVGLGVGRSRTRGGLGGQAVGLLVGASEAAHPCREPNTAQKARLQKRPRVGLERGRLHLLKVDERSGVFQLAVLVEPPEDVLAETRALACGARGQVTQDPLVVEPDIRAIHAQVKHVVQVLAAGDPRVEGEAPERLLVDGQAAAAHMVRARQARAAHGLGDPLVKSAALLPEAVVPLVLPFREVGVLVVQIVPRLRHDGHALARELPEAVHGLL